MLERADALFQELKSETRPRDLVRKMSGGQRQAVAIARTRLTKAKLILMDEPTAAISVRQVAEVLGLIRRLKAQGVSVVLISHRMPDVFAVCRPDHRSAPREQGGRQGDRTDVAGGDHRTDHGSDPCRMSAEMTVEIRPCGDLRRRRRSRSRRLFKRVVTSQPFWVTVALLVLVVGHGLDRAELRHREQFRQCRRATSRRSASWRWA